MKYFYKYKQSEVLNHMHMLQVVFQLLLIAVLMFQLGSSEPVVSNPGSDNDSSPPTETALKATPIEWRNDTAVDAARAADGEGKCPFLGIESCQILFPPAKEAVHLGTSKIGVLFFGGALVDPRSYSPIAQILSQHHGFAVAVPIFNHDLATPSILTCETGRLDLAAKAFPEVEKWVMAGHSLGGVVASIDLFTTLSAKERYKLVGGLVLLGSYIHEDYNGCGPTDFSSTNIPAAAITASLDGIMNKSGWRNGKKYLPKNDTFFMDILGGNHGQFGSYDDSERTAILGQHDGDATIPETVQRDLSVDAIVHVASRLGLPLWNGEAKEHSSPSRNKIEQEKV